MHSPFTFNPNASRAASSYQQQSGYPQPVFNIGIASGFMNHHPNLFVNQRSFTRSFASVVSCENNLEKFQNMNNVNRGNGNNGIINQQKPGLIGTILKHLKPQTQPYNYQGPSQQKEFNDYTFIPTMQCNHLQNNQHRQIFSQAPAANHISTAIPSEPFYQPPASANNNSNMTATRKIMASLFGGYQQTSQQQQPPRTRNNRWFNKSFRCRGGRGRNHNNSQFRDQAVNFPKNSQEKERTFLERDIQDDSCDFIEVFEDQNVMCSETTPEKNPNETAKGSCYSTTTTSDDPPFMIYSLEEFPAICSVARATTSAEKNPQLEKDVAKKPDEGFVCVPSEASFLTPSFTPKRTSLCEKLINSPKKLFPTCTPVTPKSCLKTRPQRRVSECSDDFIVFADECDLTFSDTESETDSDDDDDDDDEMIGVIQEDEEDEALTSDEEEDDEAMTEDGIDGVGSPEVQVDSGVEERRVSVALVLFTECFLTHIETGLLLGSL